MGVFIGTQNLVSRKAHDVSLTNKVQKNILLTRIRQIRPMQGPLDIGRPVQDEEGGPWTNSGSYPTYLWILISSTHWRSSSVLETDPWGIGTASGTRMEVLVRLRREIPSDYMGWNYIRVQGYTVLKSDTGDDMERGQGRAREMARPLTPVEDKRIKEGIPRETVVKESFWWMWSDGIAVLPPVGDTVGTFCIFVRDKSTTENQYVSLQTRL